MSDSTLFTQFLANLQVSNAADISTKYCNITARLNKDFWDTESDTAHSLQIGSYGRRTAIDGVSDLDMVFELPIANLERYKKLQANGPSVMLQEVRASLLNRYSGSDVRADGQIVGVTFAGQYRVEVLPAFKDADGNYWHGDTNDGGSWKLTKPRPEIQAVADLNNTTHGTLRDCCRMLRAWKNRVGVGMGGLLIDTLTYNFFVAHSEFHDVALGDYPALLVSLFTFYADQPDDQTYWAAPGSGQRVKRKAKFQSKARKAAARCQAAVDEEDEAKRAALWRKVFGRPFPKVAALAKATMEGAAPVAEKEEFIEDRFPVDIRHNIELECDLREGNTLQDQLRRKLRLRQRVPVGRHLRFHVAASDVPEPYDVWWKVRNRGPEAAKRSMLRGEITKDKDGRRENYETSDFAGEHYVEVYAVKDRVCVARERIAVPI